MSSMQAADASRLADTYRYWQRRILLSTIVGYALYYFVRKNLSVAMPEMEASLGIGKTQLGLYLTSHGLLYGVSKFANGIVGDRTNARWFMVSGLAICGLLNIGFGLSTSLLALGVFWTLNGWFQGMGFPPCARLMTHWFPPHRLATNMSIWNSSHSIGAAGVLVLCGYLAPIDWRLAFFVPAGIALVGAVGLAIYMRDTPESMGLPPVEGTDRESAPATAPLWPTLRNQVFNNPYIWLLALANFFVYGVRYGILDWAPSFLKQARGMELESAGWLTAGFEIAGIAGMLSSGYITDRLFKGRGARACLVYMLLCVIALAMFWKFPSNSRIWNAVMLCTAGFFIYGPQCLVGICVANLATKRAAAAAVGLTGLFGYASTSLSGFGVGWLAENYGWDAAFFAFVVCGSIAVLLFTFCWPARADGYDDLRPR